jgi:hypothetical protein
MTGGLLACLALGGGAAALSAQAVIFPQSQQAGEATLSEMGGGATLL